jgi:simple sugar transport system ATP-binding protein
LPPGQPRAALASGIGMVHQHFTLAENLTVEENITLGTRPLWSPSLGRRGARERIAALAARFGVAVDPGARVADLSVGERQRVEILKALYRDARILILDEPTAVLTPGETEALFRTLRLAVSEGLSAIFISHKLAEVMSVSDRVVVLRQGRVVGEAVTAATDRRALAALMIGADLAEPRVPAGTPGPTLLRLAGVTTRPRSGRPGLAGIDLELRAGTITGLAGVSGNGQAALAGLLAGTVRADTGTMTVRGVTVGRNWSPRQARAAGIARIPEDRHRDGTVATMSLTENAVLEAYADPGIARRGWMDWRAAQAFAAGIIADYDVRGPGPSARAGLLSGGNMQKLILGRALAGEPQVVLADQPTRGLDVGSVAYVQAQLLAARDRGAAVLVISEDLDEVLSLADVVHVIAGGRLSSPFPRGQVTAAEIGACMAGRGDLAAHAA